jgi:hypothetical protein
MIVLFGVLVAGVVGVLLTIVYKRYARLRGYNKLSAPTDEMYNKLRRHCLVKKTLEAAADKETVWNDMKNEFDKEWKVHKKRGFEYVVWNGGLHPSFKTFRKQCPLPV